LLIFIALFRGGYMIYGTIAVAVGFITLYYFLKLQRHVLFGKLPDALSGVREAPFAMALPLVILAILCVAMGVGYPLIDGHMLEAAKDALLDKAGYIGLLMGW
jgi:formate hydrogenlyase subunit 3/multisubunit Na+/H+ antiporter MnhD subunit